MAEDSAALYNPFDLGNAVIRDLPHVLVTRQAPEEHSRCTYRKQFKAEGLNGADYWIQRETRFLNYFATAKLRHVVEYAELKRLGDGIVTPVVSLLATFDAGVTIENWLRIQPRYANGMVDAHPFARVGLFLLLIRACLIALREIHALGIVHCDIKPDNICLPYTPYPFNPETDGFIRIDFEHIRIIDFAFSVNPAWPLEHNLPILPTAPYQSELLKAALRKDRAATGKPGVAAQQLDWRADFGSLSHMLKEILDTGLMPATGAAGRAAYEGAHRITAKIDSLGNGRPSKHRQLPHDGLIAEIDTLTGKLTDLSVFQGFTAAQANLAAPQWISPTPLNDTPDDAAPITGKTGDETQGKKPRSLIAAAALLLMALLAALLISYWPRTVSSPPATSTAFPACPADAKDIASYRQAQAEWWQQATGNTQASAQWQAGISELDTRLAKPNPSMRGWQTKAYALSCLSAIAQVAAPEAKALAEMAINQFKSNKQAMGKANGQWVADMFTWGADVIRTGEKTPVIAQKPDTFRLWLENVYTLDAVGDTEAAKEKRYLNKFKDKLHIADDVGFLQPTSE
ncbi:MAG: hypothetical protein ACKN9T_18935 [Candidatus Methylumidiphilus sp.]